MHYQIGYLELGLVGLSDTERLHVAHLSGHNIHTTCDIASCVRRAKLQNIGCKKEKRDLVSNSKLNSMIEFETSVPSEQSH